MIFRKNNKVKFKKETVESFIISLQDSDSGGFSSVPGGPVTLYGTCYALQTRYFLGIDYKLSAQEVEFIRNCQIETGEFIGPELQEFQAEKGVLHDRIFLIHHLTSAVLPVCLQFNIPVRYPLIFAQEYCNIEYLENWLNARDFKNAWFEGNYIFFVGQFLVYLRDVEKNPSAANALSFWFRWLNYRIDPETNLWGTNGVCSAMEAVYGGYHQLLIYYYEKHYIQNPKGLVDIVLSLQHYDGGFHPAGNGGACEDVDCVDILVNMYKQHNYRRRDIRIALRRCIRHIMALQNKDGGFSYNRGRRQTHMNIPGTTAPANISTTFATWFRIHTLALIAQVLPDNPVLKGNLFRFTDYLSMGWHREWKIDDAKKLVRKMSTINDTITDVTLDLQYRMELSRIRFHRIYRTGRKHVQSLIMRIGK